jgi:hypothetical protein
MGDEPRFSIYFSHSWRPADVELNLQVWRELADHFELLVDVPEEPGANPPYYINRIEELLRRTDLFLSVLTHRDPPPGEFSGPDARLRCSAYSLFEIRLAERADIPRLILYERSTRFSPPRRVRPWEVYQPFDRGIDRKEIEQGQWAKVIQPKIGQWKAWATNYRKPTSYEQSTVAALLVNADGAGEVCEVLEQLLTDEGYEPVRYSASQRSSEAFRLLRESGLIVADFNNQEAVFSQLYAAAHGMGLPTIRMIRSADPPLELPWIIRGEPGGYQNDIVSWTSVADLPPLIEPRIQAMGRLSAALPAADAADYLQSKRYSQFLVFISHNLKGHDRGLVDHVYALLKARNVTPFEYHQVNTAGIDWRKALDESLQKTTHFVALLSPDFEQSQTCTYELDAMLARARDVSILPFMLGGRTVPNPRLAQLHNTLLDEDLETNANRIVKEILTSLTASL